MKRYFWILVTFSLPAGLGAVTVGVANVDVGSTGLRETQATDFLQSEIQDGSSFTVRDRNAVRDIMKMVEECQLGIRKDCSDVAIKGLDVIVFSNFGKIGDEYTFALRAVNVHSFGVIFTGSESGGNSEKLMRKLSGKLKDRFKQLSGETWDPGADDSAKYKYRIAIRDIRYANEGAEKVKIAGILNSIILNAFGQQQQFQVIEQARIADLIHEKELAMEGRVSSDSAAFEGRGVTHYLIGSLKVFDGTNVLSYQIINVKTGLPIVSNIMEWTDDTELQAAMKEVATQSVETIFQINGQLSVKLCVAKEGQLPVKNVRVFLEQKKEGVAPREFGLCPLVVEDIPKGNYTAIFTHEDYNSTTIDIAIQPQQATIIEKLEMPPIDMATFNQANELEGAGNYQAAVAKYREFYQKYPRHRMSVYAMYREGFITQVYLKQFESGRAILEEVIKRKPDAEIRSETYYGIALGYRQAGQIDKATEILKMLTTEYVGSTAAESAKNCLQAGECGL